jgi:hypothetical protein
VIRLFRTGIAPDEGRVLVNADEEHVQIVDRAGGAASFTVDDARWLLTAALPAVLCTGPGATALPTADTVRR